MKHLILEEWNEYQEDGTILYCALNTFLLPDGRLQEVYSDSDGLTTVTVRHSDMIMAA